MFGVNILSASVTSTLHPAGETKKTSPENQSAVFARFHHGNYYTSVNDVDRDVFFLYRGLMEPVGDIPVVFFRDRLLDLRCILLSRRVFVQDRV